MPSGGLNKLSWRAAWLFPHQVSHKQLSAKMSTESTPTTSGTNRRILIAVDKSHQARDTLGWTLENVCMAGDLLLIVNVSASGPRAAYQRVCGRKSYDELGLKQPIDEDLYAQVVTQVKDSGQEDIEVVYIQVFASDPREPLVEYCKEFKATMAIVGKRGMSGLKVCSWEYAHNANGGGRKCLWGPCPRTWSRMRRAQ